MPISSLHHAKSNGTSLFAVLSLNILQSLDEDKIKKLADLNIYSIGDLLHYKPILHSQILMAISNREIGHDIELEQYLSNTFVNTPLSQIPDLNVSSIINVSSTDENILNTAFNVITVRDLAKFQPFIEAQMYLNDDQEVFNEPASAPEDLMPKIIGSTSTIARFNNFIKDEELVLNTKFTISNPADGANAELYNIFHTKYPKLAFGLIAGFKQEWVNMGTHLGEVIHSLALAPGESVNIVKIDWYRRESSRRSENNIVDEKLSSNLVHTRALNEVVKTTAREHLFGETSLDAATKNSGFGLTAGAASASSESGSISGDLGILGIPLKIVGSFIKSVAGAIGISAVYSKNKQTGTLTSTSDGLREVVGSLQQNINEATVQNSSNVRSLYSTVIVTDQQQETENINTRTVTNYNHSHALTIQYYEVLQRYEIINKLEKWEPIVFVPFKPIDFNIDIIKKYWFILKGPIKENFSEKYEIYNQFITNFSGTNPEFDLNGNIVVEKIKFNLSGYSSGPYIHYSFGQSFTAQEPQRHIEVSINQPAIVSKLVVNSPSDIIINRPLSDFDTLNMGWRPPMSPKTPTNSNSQCSIHINLEFSLKDEENRSTVVTMSYSRTLSYLELYQMSFSPILIKNNLEVEIRNQLGNLSNITNTDLQEEIIQHFIHNKYAYTRYLLSSIESDQLIDIIESISWMANGTNFNLTNYIHPSPLAISENYLMFSPRKLPKEYRGDLIWQKISSLNSLLIEYKKSNANRVKDTVFLPTAGVFAEAILGRSNASEFVDPRRFWNWQDSPIPFSAPQIAALQAGNHIVSDSSSELIPNIPASNLNIINPPQYPLPNSLASALQAVQNGNMFRDMAGSANLASILGNLANLANNTATLAGNLSGQAAENALNGAIELGKQVAGMVNKAAENWGSMNSNVARPPQNPTEKAGLLNTIEGVNKRNPKNEDYRPKEKAVLVSQGFDYDSLIASNDPNFIPNNNLKTNSKLGELIKPWLPLINLSFSQELKKSLSDRGMRIQFLEDAQGEVNLDFFSVKIYKFPTINGQLLTPSNFFEYVRLNIANLTPKYTEFEPYDSLDNNKWTSHNPTNCVLKIQLNPIPDITTSNLISDNAAVCTTQYDKLSTNWIFTTVNTPTTGDHPVSGNRQFKLSKINDHYSFYTLGADRTTGVLDSDIIVFNLGALNWIGFQDLIAQLINDNSGIAIINKPEIHTLQWDEVVKFKGFGGGSFGGAGAGDWY